MKIYRFTATYLFSCEAENEDDAWEQFAMDMPYKLSQYNEIEVEEEEVKNNEEKDL